MISPKETILSISLFFFCVLGKAEEIYDSREFKDYRYAGAAEITSYELQQARYGEIH